MRSDALIAGSSRTASRLPHRDDAAHERSSERARATDPTGRAFADRPGAPGATVVPLTRRVAPTVSRPSDGLVGRTVETESLAELLQSVRGGASRTLVLRGEAGIGKTVLLQSAIGLGRDMQFARVVGAPSEMELRFAGLHQLLVPFLGGVQRLPVPQRTALGAVFGLAPDTQPDRFLVGMAALTLITEAAEERPVLCVVDDAQWLDQMSVDVLGFVARRLCADRVAMLFAVGEGETGADVFDGLAELRLAGLPDHAAEELLAASAGGPVDRGVARRIASETGGNPLALVELGDVLSADELSGAAPLEEPLRCGRRTEELFRGRICAQTEDSQTLLLLAAADQAADMATVWRAAGWLGIDVGATAVPEIERLLTLSPHVQFRHPLMRSAVYHGATVAARRRAHEALAAASDPRLDEDRRAWHLAAAAIGEDESIAAELERSAGRARRRGGWASGATVLERAARLTPDPARRAQRTIAAANARVLAGEPRAAQVLLDRAGTALADPLSHGRARRLEGLIRRALGDAATATPILLEAAHELMLPDRRLARDTLLDAFDAAWSADKPAPNGGLADVLRAARAVPPGEEEPTVGDLLLDGIAALEAGRDEAGARPLHRALQIMSGDTPAPGEVLRLLCPLTAGLLLDDAAWQAITTRAVADARSQGALAALPGALTALAHFNTLAGDFAAADVAIAEAREIAAAARNPAFLRRCSCVEVTLLAWRGRETEARLAAAALIDDMGSRGQSVGLRIVQPALTVLELGLGNYDTALRRADEADAGVARFLRVQSMPDVVEAAVRCDDRRAATAALEAFSPRALASGSDWALGLLARCRALLADDEHGEPEYARAIELLERCRIAPQLARAHLLYGEWLRRQRRRRDARSQLRTAHAMFDAMGAQAFAERARIELLATGESVRKRTVETRDVLTPQEARIARLAGAGASNQEIAAQLFISAATVAYHLRKVFRKLDISKRSMLLGALDVEGRA